MNNKEIIKEFIYILIAILLGILAFKFVIWLLPIILVVIISYLIYKSIKRNKQNRVIKKNTNIKKNIKVIHDLDDED